MQINSKLTGDLEKLSVKRFNETGARVCNVLFRAKIDKQHADTLLGVEFERIAFGGMEIGAEGQALFPCATITKPRLICESHTIRILGQDTVVIPEIPRITPCDQEQAVIVDFVFPVLVNDATAPLVADLATSVGDVVEVVFIAKQLELPGVRVLRQTKAFGNQVPAVIE